ncbi:unnamed protein product, partial [Discosporangium mesarthrocarpum]
VREESGHDDEDEESEETHIVDNHGIDTLEPFVRDLYYATALPQGVDATRLRDLRKRAAAAAGAIANVCGLPDRATSLPPRLTSCLGGERVDELEQGACILIA